MTSVTDQSDMEHLDEVSRAERRTKSRRSWMPTSPSRKRHNNEPVGLGLAAAASPTLGATNPGAERSTSSVGSWHQASRSSPSDLQQFVNDPANQPLSLDAEVSNNSSKNIGTEQPERRSLFGKFKAKVGLSRDSRDAGGGSSERTKSPVTSEGPWNSGSSLALSPPPTSREPMGRTTPVEGSRSEEPLQSPVSPQLGSSMPPAIPEEPSPTMATTPAVAPAATTEAAETAPESAKPAAETAEPASAAQPAEPVASTEPAAAAVEPAAESAAEPAAPAVEQTVQESANITEPAAVEETAPAQESATQEPAATTDAASTTTQADPPK